MVAPAAAIIVDKNGRYKRLHKVQTVKRSSDATTLLLSSTWMRVADTLHTSHIAGWFIFYFWESFSCVGWTVAAQRECCCCSNAVMVVVVARRSTCSKGYCRLVLTAPHIMIHEPEELLAQWEHVPLCCCMYIEWHRLCFASYSTPVEEDDNFFKSTCCPSSKLSERECPSLYVSSRAAFA